MLIDYLQLSLFVSTFACVALLFTGLKVSSDRAMKTGILSVGNFDFQLVSGRSVTSN